LNATEQLENAKAARDKARAHLDELRERETKLLTEIDDLADQARNGKSGAGRPLVELSEEVGAVRARLNTAEGELVTAESALQRVLTADRHREFYALLTEVVRQKELLIHHHRAACAALGLHCKLLAEATTIGNELCCNLADGLPTRAALQSAAKIDLRFTNWDGLDGECYELWTGVGYNLSFPISPIIQKQRKEQP
jgi:hypothetical protein